MCQAVLSPNLTKKFQWEVSQIAHNRFPCVTLLGGLSVNLNHLKSLHFITTGQQIVYQEFHFLGPISVETNSRTYYGTYM